MAIALVLPPSTVTVSAASGDRTLTFYHTHTQKTGTFTFRRNGQYDQTVLRQMNIFLADWRTHEPTKMDPALFDLLWEIYTDVRGTQPINIVSSYRSPKTNAMLRKSSSGVAENSQHMRGKAMDIFIPGVNLSKLREVAMRHQVGGVGYYPTSGSPFVHVDTGSVRAWPRMTKAQLKRVFPDGRTLHLPTDGKPLSSSGRAYALAEWSKCHTVPCGGLPALPTIDDGIRLAENNGMEPPVPATRPAALFGGAEVQVASLEQEPVQRSVATLAITAPIPIERPAELLAEQPSVANGDYDAWTAAGSPIPVTKSPRIVLATRSPLGGEGAQTALAALAALEDPVPQPRVLMTPRDDNMVTAYVATEAEPGAQLALKMIIERETTASMPDLPATRPLDPVEHTASIGENAFAGLFDQTFSALTRSLAPSPMQQALVELAQSRQPIESISQREAELTAPEIDHVNETLVEPVAMTTGFWAVMTDQEGYLDKATELGPMTGRLGFIDADTPIPEYDTFLAIGPTLVADRG